MVPFLFDVTFNIGNHAMPNWCKNTLEITANTLAEFRQVFDKVMKFDTEKQQFCLDFNLLAVLSITNMFFVGWNSRDSPEKVCTTA